MLAEALGKQTGQAWPSYTEIKHCKIVGGRLRRFFQGHIAQRWDASIEVCKVHTLDSLLVITTRSTKYGEQYSLEKDLEVMAQRARSPECCACGHRGCKYDQILIANNGHFACTVHRCWQDGKLHCVHSQPWKAQMTPDRN